MGGKTDLSLWAIANRFGAQQPDQSKTGIEHLRNLALPPDIPSWQPQGGKDYGKPSYFPGPAGGEVQTVYFPLSEAISGTVGHGVKEATGSPALGFAAEFLTPSPTQIMKGLKNLGKPMVSKIFTGEKSATWDKAAAGRARTMEAGGHSQERIWEVTGTVRGPDGKWRQEISDFGTAQPQLSADSARHIAAGSPATMTRQQALLHPKLSAAYPESKNILVQAVPDRVGGSYDPPSGRSPGEIIVGANRQTGVRNRSTLLHELQHAVQEGEGFASGGSPASLEGSLYDRARSTLLTKRSNLMSSPEYRQAEDLKANAIREAVTKARISAAADPLNSDLIYQKIMGEENRRINKLFNELPVVQKGDEFLDEINKLPTPFNLYQRLAGEAESRLVQARADMTPEQLRAQFPYDPEYFQGATGVSLGDLIVRGKAGGPSLMTGGFADELPATVSAAAPRVIDDNALRALRVKATELEDAGRGISLYVTHDGQAIVSKPYGKKTPARLEAFAKENNLEYSEATWRRPVNKANPLHSIPMPVEYRESGAKYHWE